jgi:hypothetical protein
MIADQPRKKNNIEKTFINKLPLCHLVEDEQWFCPCGNKNREWRDDNNLDNTISSGKKSTFEINGFIDHLNKKGEMNLDAGDVYHYVIMIYLRNLYPGLFGEMPSPEGAVATATLPPADGPEAMAVASPSPTSTTTGKLPPHPSSPHVARPEAHLLRSARRTT